MSKKLLNQFSKLIPRPKFIILGPIYFLALNSSANLINKKVTAFSWISDPDKPFSGKCYEYDIETGGQAFQAVTSKSKCRPDKTIYHWVPSERGVSGKCFEIDEETKGQKFARSTAVSKCVSENVRYAWELTSEISGECFEIDGNLKRKVSKGLCAPSKVDHHWLSRENGWGGKCYAVDSIQGPSGYIESVNTNNCKPNDTTFVLNMKKEGDQGYCYEVAVNGGEKAFSKRVSRSSCFSNPSVKHMWKKDKSGIGGDCLEVRKTADSRISTRKVDYKNCVDFKTKYFFKRTGSYSGECLLIDTPSSGVNFSKSVVKRNCREAVKDIQYSLVANEFGKPICIESDKETGGDLFISKVSISKCEETNIKPKWILEEDGWSGKCVELRTIGNSVREKSINKELCRPKEVRTLWHNFSKLNGKCFDVDAKLGTIGFVKEAPLKKCAPKFTKYIFYREKGSNAGNCYLVDRETSGEKFNKKASPKKCRENLIKVPLD